MGILLGMFSQRRLPTSFYRYSWSVVFQRNLMFAASSGVIVKSKTLSMESWEKFYKRIRGRGGGERILLV